MATEQQAPVSCAELIRTGKEMYAVDSESTDNDEWTNSSESQLDELFVMLNGLRIELKNGKTKRRKFGSSSSSTKFSEGEEEEEELNDRSYVIVDININVLLVPPSLAINN